MRKVTMQRFSYLVAALVMVAGACSDDGTPVKKDGTVTPDVGKKDGPVVKPDGTVVKPDGTVVKPDGTAPSGKCTNAADLAKLDTKPERDAVSAKAKTCGVGCILNADKKKCTTDCLTKPEPEGAGLSVDCTGCYVDIVLCAATNCMTPCLADPNGQPCADCQQGKPPSTTGVNCVTPFYTCSGLTP
jgi:hypothetical protein